MADPMPPIPSDVNWHTWVSAAVNYLVVAVVGAVVAYIAAHPMPPVIPVPPAIVAPAPQVTMPSDEQVKLWLDARQKK